MLMRNPGSPPRHRRCGQGATDGLHEHQPEQASDDRGRQVELLEQADLDAQELADHQQDAQRAE